MLTFSDAKQIFPSLWLVMCIGEHQTQLSILRWFSSMAADEFLFNEKEYRKEIALKLHLQNMETKKKNQKENQDQQEDEDDDDDVDNVKIDSMTKEEALANELNNTSHDDAEQVVTHIERHMLWEAFLWLGVHLLNAENLKIESMVSNSKRKYSSERERCIAIWKAL